MKNKRTLKLIVEYDGSDFAGWQIQPNQRTVQGEIEKALRILTQEDIRVIGSGRTDAGVHAVGQVVSFQLYSKLPLDQFYKGLNGLLPEDIQISDVSEIPQPFNARRNAISRSYRYVVSKEYRAIKRRYVWYPRTAFTIEPMRQASKCLIGEHDFASFCTANGETDHFISRVSDASWKIMDDEIYFEITADRFYHHMVRSIVGTLLEVGRGKISPEHFCHILEAKDRTYAGPTAPPHGLFLVGVEY